MVVSSYLTGSEGVIIDRGLINGALEESSVTVTNLQSVGSIADRLVGDGAGPIDTIDVDLTCRAILGPDNVMPRCCITDLNRRDSDDRDSLLGNLNTIIVEAQTIVTISFGEDVTISTHPQCSSLDPSFKRKDIAGIESSMMSNGDLTVDSIRASLLTLMAD